MALIDRVVEAIAIGGTEAGLAIWRDGPTPQERALSRARRDDLRYRRLQHLKSFDQGITPSTDERLQDIAKRLESVTIDQRVHHHHYYQRAQEVSHSQDQPSRGKGGVDV